MKRLPKQQRIRYIQPELPTRIAVRQSKILLNRKIKKRLDKRKKGVYRNLQFSLDYKRYKDAKIFQHRALRHQMKINLSELKNRPKKFSYSKLLSALEDNHDVLKNKLQYNVFKKVTNLFKRRKGGSNP